MAFIAIAAFKSLFYIPSLFLRKRQEFLGWGVTPHLYPMFTFGKTLFLSSRKYGGEGGEFEARILSVSGGNYPKITYRNLTFCPLLQKIFTMNYPKITYARNLTFIHHELPEKLSR
jgi:hypothetical protein